MVHVIRKIEISDILLQKITQAFDSDGDIVVGEERELIMIRTGDSSDQEYTISIEKVLLSDDEIEDYEILETFSMEKGNSETILEATKSFLEKSSWNTKKLEKFFSYY